MGMRKDFIVKKEEKQKRKKHPEVSSTPLVNNSDSLPQTFDEIDHVSFIF